MSCTCCNISPCRNASPLEVRLDSLEARIASLEGEKTPWKPKIGEQYWTAEYDSPPSLRTWNDIEWDRERLLAHNVFKTEKEAEYAAKVLKLTLKILSRPKFEPKDGDNVSGLSDNGSPVLFRFAVGSPWCRRVLAAGGFFPSTEAANDVATVRKLLAHTDDEA